MAKAILALAQRAELHLLLTGRPGVAGPAVLPRPPSMEPEGSAELVATLRALIDWDDPDALGVERARLHALLDRQDAGGPADTGGTGTPEHAWRLAWMVVDAVRALGPEGAARFSRELPLQRMAAAVLQHVVPAGEVDGDEDAHGLAVARVALRATLASAGLPGSAGAAWAGAILGAVTRATSVLPAIERASFVRTWLESPSYPRLLNTALARAGDLHCNAHAVAFGDIAAVVLGAAIGAAREQPGFASYWSARWGHALRPVLGAVTELGPSALEERAPRIADLATMLVHLLAVTPTRGYIDAETLAGVLEAALAATAVHPAPRPRIDASWLDSFLHAVTDTLSDPGVRQVVPASGIELLIQHVLAALVRHPESAQAHPALVQILVRGVLDALGETAGSAAYDLASAAIHAALGPVTTQPALVDAGYPQQLAALAGTLGALVHQRALTRTQAAGMLRAFAAALAEAPRFFLEEEPALTGQLPGIMVSLAETSSMVAGPGAVAATRAVLQALVRSGHAALDSHTGQPLAPALEAMLRAALAHAGDSAGAGLGQHDAPAVLGSMVESWARGHFSQPDARDSEFQERFAAAVRRAVA